MPAIYMNASTFRIITRVKTSFISSHFVFSIQLTGKDILWWIKSVWNIILNQICALESYLCPICNFVPVYTLTYTEPRTLFSSALIILKPHNNLVILNFPFWEEKRNKNSVRALLLIDYKDQTFNIIYVSSHCALWLPYGSYKVILWKSVKFWIVTVTGPMSS